MIMFEKRYLAIIISIAIEFCLFILTQYSNMMSNISLDVYKWLSHVPVYLAGVLAIWLVTIYCLDSSKIRRNFIETLARHRKCNYLRGPSIGTIFIISLLLLSLQWISFAIWWIWGTAVQVSILLFLLIRFHANSESNIENLKNKLINRKNLSVKNQGIRAHHYKYFIAALLLLSIETCSSIFVLLERLNYGFYDRTLLAVMIIVGLIGAIPVYCLVCLSPIYTSKR